MFDFQKLEIYKKAKHFHSECKLIIKNHNFDRYVNNQLGRASFSVALNIAEGSGKLTKGSRKNYFTIARASLFECVAILDILTDEELLSQQIFEKLCHLADEMSRILYTMIKNLT